MIEAHSALEVRVCHSHRIAFELGVVDQASQARPASGGSAVGEYLLHSTRKRQGEERDWTFEEKQSARLRRAGLHFLWEHYYGCGVDGGGKAHGRMKSSPATSKTDGLYFAASSIGM